MIVNKFYKKKRCKTLKQIDVIKKHIEEFERAETGIERRIKWSVIINDINKICHCKSNKKHLVNQQKKSIMNRYMKYQIGDKITIKKDLPVEGSCKEMQKYCGQNAHIIGIEEQYGAYKLDIDNNRYLWLENFLPLIHIPKQT